MYCIRMGAERSGEGKKTHGARVYGARLLQPVGPHGLPHVTLSLLQGRVFVESGVLLCLLSLRGSLGSRDFPWFKAHKTHKALTLLSSLHHHHHLTKVSRKQERRTFAILYTQGRRRNLLQNLLRYGLAER